MSDHPVVVSRDLSQVCIGRKQSELVHNSDFCDQRVVNIAAPAAVLGIEIILDLSVNNPVAQLAPIDTRHVQDGGLGRQ